MTIADANAAGDAGHYRAAARLGRPGRRGRSFAIPPAKIVQWQLRWSVQACDIGLTQTARHELLAALPDRRRWVRSAHEASIFLADTGLHDDASTLNAQLAEHLESAGDSQSAATLASVPINPWQRRGRARTLRRRTGYFHARWQGSARRRRQ